MKKAIQIILLVFFCSKLSIGQDLRFFYAAPRATMEAAFGANNVLGVFRDSSGTHIPLLNGYRYTRIVARNRAAFRSIAPPSIKKTYDSLITSTSTLRRKARRVLDISKGKVHFVQVFMIDDRTFLPSGESWVFCATPSDSGTIAWPCALNDSLNRFSNYGSISFGERAARSESSFTAWESTLLHEFSHTQMLQRHSNANCKWGTNCVAIAYGGDDGHWFEELQADEQSPLDEGFGNFWALEHEPSLRNYTDRFLADSTYKFILGSHSFLSGIPQMWNAPHFVFGNATVPPRDADGNRNVTITNNGRSLDINLVGEQIQTGASYQVRKYKWLDVPGDFIFYNEVMFQAMMYIYHEKAFASKDSSLNKILKAANYLSPLSDHQRHRYPANVAMKLAKMMEEYANTTVGRREETNNTLVSSLFPIALYDMLTHFGQTDTEFQRELDVANYHVEGITNFGQPRAKAEYLAKRAEIKRLVCPFLSANSECRQANAPIKMDLAISALLTYCRDSSRILR